MKKFLLTLVTILTTLCASAQFSVMTTISSVEDEAGETTYSITDKIGVGYQVTDKLMIGATMDGMEDTDGYDLLARYALMNGIWATCIYNYDSDSDEVINKMDLGIGYSFKVWDKLYIDPNFTMPLEADEAGEREGSFNLSISYKL
tara:strand:+ start:16074 stop:16511 length:438 start_codon:yes stop_codon:yes gene_type:complete